MILRTRIPSVWRSILVGTLVAIVATVSTIGCLVIADAYIYEPLAHQSALPALSMNPGDALMFFFYCLLLTSILSLLVIIPSATGGALIGFTLQRLASQKVMGLPVVLIVGTFIGFAVGSLSASMIFRLTTLTSEFKPRIDPLWSGLAGILVGLIDSLLVGTWLSTRMQRD